MGHTLYKTVKWIGPKSFKMKAYAKDGIELPGHLWVETVSAEDLERAVYDSIPPMEYKGYVSVGNIDWNKVLDNLLDEIK